jgi:hypothetical protein
MSVLVDLEPNLESELNTLAARAGVSVNEYLASIISREVGRSHDRKPQPQNLMDLAADIRELGGEPLDLSRTPSYSRDAELP